MLNTKYNYFEKIIHKLALSNYNIVNLLFYFEDLFFSKKTKLNEKNFFISGLARSGTTQFLNILYDTNKFASYTYEDMPFIFSPNTWKKTRSLFRSKQIPKIERAHSDKIEIDLLSPEALEEPIWMYIRKQDYINKNYISSHELKKQDIEFFIKIINLVKVKSERDFYLSKNNFNILRINSLLNYFKKSYFFIIFRHPLEQAYSLYRQHLNFLKLQEEDSFVLKYMNSLGHFDFGQNHKLFLFDKKFDQSPNILDLNYWLSNWIKVYTYLHQFKKKYDNCKFICYETLCEEKEDYLKKIIPDENSLIKLINFENFQNKNKNIDPIQFDKTLVKNSISLYQRLANMGF